MEINTTHFGPIIYTKEDVIHFTDGLFGFERMTDFLPIAFDSRNDAMLSLQSIADEHLAFIIMNPFLLLNNYNPCLNDKDMAAIGALTEDDISYYVICTTQSDAAQSTVNLKCPIIVNAMTRQAKQVILESDCYLFRHTLSALHSGEESLC